MSSTAPSPLATTNEVAAYLNVRPATIWRMTQDGRLPKPIKLGTGRKAPARWRWEDVHALANRFSYSSPGAGDSPAGRSTPEGTGSK